jgi:hypothetical protein
LIWLREMIRINTVRRETLQKWKLPSSHLSSPLNDWTTIKVRKTLILDPMKNKKRKTSNSFPFFREQD